jgi:hypothetical protein
MTDAEYGRKWAAQAGLVVYQLADTSQWHIQGAQLPALTCRLYHRSEEQAYDCIGRFVRQQHRMFPILVEETATWEREEIAKIVEDYRCYGMKNGELVWETLAVWDDDEIVRLDDERLVKVIRERGAR